MRAVNNYLNHCLPALVRKAIPNPSEILTNTSAFVVNFQALAKKSSWNISADLQRSCPNKTKDYHRKEFILRIFYFCRKWTEEFIEQNCNNRTSQRWRLFIYLSIYLLIYLFHYLLIYLLNGFIWLFILFICIYTKWWFTSNNVWCSYLTEVLIYQCKNKTGSTSVFWKLLSAIFLCPKKIIIIMKGLLINAWTFMTLNFEALRPWGRFKLKILDIYSYDDVHLIIKCKLNVDHKVVLSLTTQESG